jgi:pilus assembly protein CpaB
MVLRIVLFAMMALGLGGFGVVAWIATKPPVEAVASQAPVPVVEEPKPQPKVHVLVAARSVRAGALLKPEEIATLEVDQSAVPDGATVDSAANRSGLVGAMVRRAITSGEILLASEMMRPGDHGFLAAVLTAGMRAVTIGVDAITGTAGLIWPGDRVDVIMTYTIEDPKLSLGQRVAARTVLYNVRVIAIDQQLVQGALPGGAEGNTARTVTMEVTSEQAQRVQIAARLGRLSLSVRASDAGEVLASNDLRATYAEDLEPNLGGQDKKTHDNTLRLHSGNGESKEYKF